VSGREQGAFLVHVRSKLVKKFASMLHVSCRLGENRLCVDNQVQDLTINGNYHKQKQCLANLSFKYEKLIFNSIYIFVCQHLYVGDFRKL
jgi:hypothetical protein